MSKLAPLPMSDGALLRALFDQQAAILDELRALRREVAEISLPAEDRELITRLLPALAGAVGSASFAAADALDYGAVRAVVGNLSPIALGKLLGLAVGRSINGLAIVRAGRSNATLYRVASDDLPDLTRQSA